MAGQTSTSSSKGRSSSPFSHRRPYPSSSLSNASSSSSLMNGRLIPRSSPSSVTSSSFPRSAPPGRGRSGGGESLDFSVNDSQSGGATVDAPVSGESIAVTVRFRPLR